MPTRVCERTRVGFFQASEIPVNVLDQSQAKRKFTRFLIAAALLGMVSGLFDNTLNNYLSEVVQVTTRQRGMIEFPREMPGFLVTLVAGALVSLSLSRTGAVAIALLAVGLGALSFLPVHLPAALVCLVIWSTGAHLYMPISSSIALSLSSVERRATSLAQVGAVGIFGTILGAAVVAIAMRRQWISFRGVFMLAAVIAAVAAVTVASMGRVEKPGTARRQAFVFKRRYWLYYLLCALYGVRKQVFMTFGLWIIVKNFAQPASSIAVLAIIYSFIGLFTQPFVGRLIDKWGESRVLVCEGIVLAAVCATYALAGGYRDSRAAL
jgi:MFS family permease